MSQSIGNDLVFPYPVKVTGQNPAHEIAAPNGFAILFLSADVGTAGI